MRRVQHGSPGQRPADSMEVSMDVISNFAARFERTPRRRAVARGVPRRVQAQPAGLRHRRRAHARRRSASPSWSTRATTRACRASSPTRSSRSIPAFRRVLRHGRRDRAGRRRTSATPRRASRRRSRSSTCSARSAAASRSIAERLKQLMEQRAVLRDQGLAGERVAARPVRRRRRRRRSSRRNTASRAAT